MFPYAGDPRWGHMNSYFFTCDKEAGVPLLGTLTTQASAPDGQSPVVSYAITE